MYEDIRGFIYNWRCTYPYVIGNPKNDRTLINFAKTNYYEKNYNHINYPADNY